MASENLQIRTIISQISVNNYMLSDIQQQRADIAEELTDVIQQFGQDSPQYQSALAQTNAIDADLELEQNELQISNQQLAAWFSLIPISFALWDKQTFMALSQRGANGHPSGILSKSTGVPPIGSKRCSSSLTVGMERISPLVYSCFGL